MKRQIQAQRKSLGNKVQSHRAGTFENLANTTRQSKFVKELALISFLNLPPFKNFYTAKARPKRDGEALNRTESYDTEDRTSACKTTKLSLRAKQKQ